MTLHFVTDQHDPSRRRARTALRGALLLPAVALAVAACSSTTSGTAVADRSTPQAPAASSTPSSPAPSISSPVNPATINPCGLVTKVEADTVAGTKTLPPVRALSLCTFPTPTSGAVGQLEVYVGDGAKQQFDIDKIRLKHTFVKIPGIGDEAWSEDANFFFRKGSTWVSLRVTRLDGVKTEPLLQQLAAIVVTRLP